MSMTDDRVTGAKSPADAFLNFNGQIGATTISYRGGDKKKTINSFQMFIVDDGFQEIAGGHMNTGLFFDSNRGYEGKVQFSVYEKIGATGQRTLSGTGAWKGVLKPKLKPRGAKLITNAYGYLISIDGQGVQPIICKMDVGGMSSWWYATQLRSQVKRNEGSGCRVSVSSHTKQKTRQGNEVFVPDFKFVYCKGKEAEKKWWDMGLSLADQVINPFRDAILLSNPAAADKNAQANDWGANTPGAPQPQGFDPNWKPQTEKRHTPGTSQSGAETQPAGSAQDVPAWVKG